MSRGGEGRCPTCRGPSRRETAGKAFPFCGARCWALDLGKWLGEEYRVADESPDGVPPPPGDPES